MSLLHLPGQVVVEVLRRLRPTTADAPVRPPAAAATPAPPEPETSRPPRRRVGKYDASLTALVTRRPGITVAEAAAKLGVHPTALYPVIRRLEEQHKLVKDGRQLHPDVAGTSRARPGKYEAPLTALIARQPGSTVAEAASVLDVHPTSLYPAIRRLQADGSLTKRGRELHPGQPPD